MSIKPEELKPCPFCGNSKTFSMNAESSVFCFGCDACDARVYGISEKAAKKRWNTRAIPDTHRVVPVKPTPEMINAALPHAMRESDEDKYRAIGEIICIWDEMLAAHAATASQGGE